MTEPRNTQLHGNTAPLVPALKALMRVALHSPQAVKCFLDRGDIATTTAGVDIAESTDSVVMALYPSERLAAFLVAFGDQSEPELTAPTALPAEYLNSVQSGIVHALSDQPGRAIIGVDVAKDCLAEDAAPAQPTKSVEWRIRLDGERFFFRRYVDGHCDESYRSVFAPEAAVWAAAIIQRFQPPPSLRESDIPAG